MPDSRYAAGIDLGSTASKCVILENGERIAGKALIPSGAGTSGPERAMAGALEAAGLRREDLAAVTATGYGRNALPGADYVVSELSCHAKAAHHCYPGVRTVIDIGGQDAKAIALDGNGRMLNFIMNDKCAAGTGRFLDVMARVLELDVSEMGDTDAKAVQPVAISSTCTVFAESEVISRLAKKTPIPDLVAGIHLSVANRTVSLVRRLGICDPVVMTGGVSQNAGIVRALEKELKTEIHTLELAQFMGAYGAALYSWEKIR